MRTTRVDQLFENQADAFVLRHLCDGPHSEREIETAVAAASHRLWPPGSIAACLRRLERAGSVQRDGTSEQPMFSLTEDGRGDVAIICVLEAALK